MNSIRNYQKELDSIIEEIRSRTSDLETENPPRLLLHSCCAPCSSYVLEYLRRFFRITVFYYNPNISMEPEYVKRVEEQKRLIAAYNENLKQEQASQAELKQEQASQAELKQKQASQAELKQKQAFQAELKQEQASQPELQQDMLVESKLRIKDEAGTAYPIEIIEGDYEPERFFEAVRGLEECPEGGERCFACYDLRLRKTSQIAASGKFDYFTTTLTISPLKNAPKLNEIGERLAGECGIKWLPSDFKKKGGYQRSIELSKEYGLYRQNYCGCVYSKTSE